MKFSCNESFKYPGCVFTNHSLERSLSYSPDFSIFRSIWMWHNFRLAKSYGLANQKLCHILICKSWRKRQRMFLRMVVEYGPLSIKHICEGHEEKYHVTSPKYIRHVTMEGNIRQNSMGLHDILICDYYKLICFLSYILHIYYISRVIIASSYCLMLIPFFFLVCVCHEVVIQLCVLLFIISLLTW